MTNQRAILAATMLGSSVAFIDGSVINVALPALQHDFAASPAGLSWTIDAYLLPLGALILIGGGAGDHFGRKRLFLIGLAIFTLASVACAAAPSLAWLLAGRGLQGIGAALLMPNSLAILGAGFPAETRGTAIGTWAAAGALASTIGPLAGGWLVDNIGWRTIFLLNVPIATAAALLAAAYVPESRGEHRSAALDWTGAAVATAALALLTWSLTAASGGSARSPLIWLAAAAGALLLALFVLLEARLGDRAIMPVSLFTTRAFVGLTLLTFFLYGSLGGLLVLLPFLLIKIAGLSAIAAGGALLPISILIGAGSPVMGRLAARIGSRLPLAAGAAIVAAGLGLFARVPATAIGYVADILLPTLLVGLGLAISVAPLTTAVMASVERDHVGTASGFNSAVARVAGLIATALLGLVFARQGSAAGFISAFHTAALVGAASALVASASATLLLGGGRASPLPTTPGEPVLDL